VEAAVMKVGIVQNEAHIGANAMYRAQLLDWACVFDLQACIDYAAELKNKWSTDGTPVPQELVT